MDLIESAAESRSGSGSDGPLYDVLQIARLAADAPFAQVCLGAEVLAWSGRTSEHQPLIEFATTAELHPSGTTIALTAGFPAWAESMHAVSITGPYAEAAWLIVVTDDIDAFAGRASMLIQAAGALAERALDRSVEQARIDDLGESLRRSRADLRLSNERLEISNRELEQFAYVASHELVSPLRAASVYAQLLSQLLGDADLDRATGDKVMSCVDEITRGVGLMSSQVQSLLELSSVNSTATMPEPVHVAEVVANALETLAPQLVEREAQVTVGQLPVVHGQLVPLQSVFANLVSNSLRYSKPGRPLEINIDSTTSEDDHVITVRDNGVGVAEADVDRIFGLFERASTSTDGTGIGLALSRRIVESFGGSIGVETGTENGSVFWVRMPVSSPASNALA